MNWVGKSVSAQSSVPFRPQLTSLAAVAKYFLQHNYRLKHPNLPCVQLTRDMWWPLELVKVASLATLDPETDWTEQQASSRSLIRHTYRHLQLI